jgi:putative FmdB family regulatory protein
MPIYEYQCSDCGKVFEVFQKIADPPLQECRICKGRLQKLISHCSFHLKGTGWYVTDYKKTTDSAGMAPGPVNGKKLEAAADTKADTTSGAKSEAKAESKTTETTGG